MHEVVYKVDSQQEQLRVMARLQQAGLDPIVQQDWTPDPTLLQVSGYTYTIPIAVPADQAEQARIILADIDVPDDQETGGVHAGCMAALAAGFLGLLVGGGLCWAIYGGLRPAVRGGAALGLILAISAGILTAMRKKPRET